MAHTRWPRPWFVGVVVWLLGTATSALARDLVIATVNNGHMLTLQRMTPHFERLHPGVRVRWVTLDEDRLRQQVTRDVATRGGRFDLLTVGSYEAKVWSGRGWLRPITPSAGYATDDLLPPVRDALTQGGKLYALPFYGESSMTMVRTDLLAAAGMTLPLHPTWEQVAQAARRLHDPQRGVAGICLRGKPGWGQNMALVSTMVNTHGGQWFDTKWQPQLTSPAWRRALTLYSDLLRRHGPPAAVANGYNENLALFSAGRCAMWVDATVAGNFVSRGNESRVAGQVAFLHAPVASTARGARWLWTWSLAIPAGSRQPELAQRFAEWASSPAYVALVAREVGWHAVPPGTRESTYAQPAYRMANPHAAIEREAIMLADQNRPTEPPSPYVGIQWVGIPEFQSIGTAVGQLVAELLQTAPPRVDEVLTRAQAVAERKVREAGYMTD
ncbi:extracellular solute-binding protein [Aquabacterium fontiphilum]|uniref:ABC transporter substrate-binding protein n=1 Tax=Aquabacterium fontiphilum TaxID=450365 RepID=UPI0013770C96|nr:sugar ABC transporter substrate-binding protein [Aquabacterium fontiphilum]NBD20553.1 extracellular solute-binding protein [Aquabacterium fontiphilum]